MYLSDNECWVYFIRCKDENNGPIKIGMSWEPMFRLDALQRMTPYELTFIHKEKVRTRALAFKLEAELLKEFKNSRIRGEWFNGDIDINLAMKTCRSFKRRNPKPKPKLKPSDFLYSLNKEILNG